MNKTRFFLSLISILVISNLAWSSPVDPTEARSLAQTFWRLNFPGQALPVFEELSQSVGVEHFYIFNNVNGPGFVMVSGDDCATPILGYSSTTNGIGGELPANVRSWLGYYDGTIGAAVQNGAVATAEIAEEWSTLRAGNLPEPKSLTTVSPLISTTWDQGAPYNNLCPGTGTNKAYVGCVATAMAQLMKYYNWPTTGTGSHSYYCNDGTYDYGTLSANFGATTYDWANMLNSYPYPNSGTATQQNAVATLMYHCGVAINMVYTPEGSGAWTIGTSYPYYPSAETALKEHFNYSSSLYGALMSNYSNVQWISMLKNDLDQQHPVIYAGNDQNGEGGHCFVCDGYDNTNNFHFNWGWSGWYDGYFTLTSLTPGTGGAGAGNSNYSYYQQAIFGAVPNGGSTPPNPGNCEYLHYPLPGTPDLYVLQSGGGYLSGSNYYGDLAKADYFTHTGNGSIEKIKVTFGALDGVNGSVAFTVWADNNGVPGNVIGGKTVNLSSIYTTAMNNNGDYECVFDSPVPITGNFFAGIDISNAISPVALMTTQAGTAANTGWEMSSSGEWSPYNSASSWQMALTNAIFPYVCEATTPDPTSNTNLVVYSNYSYTPNPLQQNQAATVEVSVGNAASTDFTGTIKLALLTANNTEAQVIGQLSGSISSMTYAPLQYSGTITVPAGTYQMAVLSQASGESTWTLVGTGAGYPNPVSVTVVGGSTPPDPTDTTGCAYLHYPLPGTPAVYTADGGGYLAGSNVYGDEAKADYFTHSGNGTVEKIKITIGAMDGTNGSVVFKVWADNNGTPGAVLGSKTVTLSEISNNTNTSSEYECVFTTPINVSGNFFAGLDVTNATSYFGLVTTTDGTGANTGWEYYDGDWTTYSDSWDMDLTNAIFPYVCSESDPNPPVTTTDLHVYSDFTYTPNPMQQNQSVSVEVNVANTGSSAFNGLLKLALLNASNTEAQVIGQSSISLNSMSYFNFQFSGNITVPAGTYQMAVYSQASGTNTWTLVGTNLGHANPVSVTVTGGSNPPVNDFHLAMYEDMSYMPNPMQQNQTVTVNATVANSGNGTFNGNFKLVLLNGNTEVQTIGQTNGSLNTMTYSPLQFSGTVTVMPGTYNMAVYYQANGELGWTLVGNDLGHANPVSVTVAGGSNPPVENVDLNMFADFMYMPNPLQQNATAYFSASVINMGNTAFTGSLRLVLETNNDEHVQTIQQIPVTAPVAPNASAAYNFSGTITAAPGFYKLVLYYKPDGASSWLIVGSNYNASYQNPKPVVVNAPDGIEDLTLEAATLRPNPATDHFYLDVPDQTIDRLEIYSSTGQLVHAQGNLTSGESIGISFLRSGVYFVRFESSGRVGVQKLIVR
ncbi:MAG: thiol protease/hemagglutinin PrtT [Bacteroidales bacterium]|nr:thiol protease/hemagglutinin PrtT [Bacteroidales bacterium]